MTIRIGTTSVNQLRIGTNLVTQVRIGTNLAWSGSALRDDFNYPDTGNLVTTGDWTDDGHVDYTAGVVAGACRIAIPDGLIFTAAQLSRMRYTAALLAGDDGYLEFRVANPGAPWGFFNFGTQVYRRLNNDNSNDGVGVDLNASALSIVRRVGGGEAPMAACGSYGGGDVVRLQQVGNVHSVYVNGALRNSWDDSGATAHKGIGYRRVGVAVSGGKEFFGARRFSPSLDYIEAA